MFHDEVFFAFPIETTIVYKGPQYDHIHNLVINFEVVSEKKAFEHFPIGSNVNLCIAVAAILDFRSE
jgi:hypothetical protein